MKIYNTVEDYLIDAEIGDRVVFGGRGIVDGISTLESKYDTYKVVGFNREGKLVVTAYRGKKKYCFPYNQKMAVVSKETFNKLTA